MTYFVKIDEQESEIFTNVEKAFKFAKELDKSFPDQDVSLWAIVDGNKIKLQPVMTAEKVN